MAAHFLMLSSILLAFLAITTGRTAGLGVEQEFNSLVSLVEQLDSFLRPLAIDEDKIKHSIECVRKILQTGLPEYHFPSFEPLLFKDVSFNLTEMEIPGISGFVHLENGICEGISKWKMHNVQGAYVATPPTFTVEFLMHYDQIYCKMDRYRFNVNYWGGGNADGDGTLYSSVQNLNASGHIKALVAPENLTLHELDAPITVENVQFKITGLLNDPDVSSVVSSAISNFLPSFLNDHPEIFSTVIGPFVTMITNSLVHGNIGIGIVKTISQRCILDVIYPPTV